MKKYILALLILSSSLFSQTESLTSKSVILNWDANTETDLSGYTIKIGKTSNQLTTSHNVGKVTQWKTPELDLGIWYSSAFAFNTDGLESLPSEELILNIRRVTSQISFDGKTWVMSSDKVYCFPSKSDPVILSVPIISVNSTEKFFRYHFRDEAAPTNTISLSALKGTYLHWDPPAPDEKITSYRVYQIISGKWEVKSVISVPYICFRVANSGTYSVASLNSEGIESPKSNSLTVSLSSRPNPPKNFKAKR